MLEMCDNVRKKSEKNVTQTARFEMSSEKKNDCEPLLLKS